MFDKIWGKWQDHGFEIILVFSIVAILILALFRIGKKGSWATKYTYKPTQLKTRKRRGPPTESKGEAECRRVLQNLFNKPFPKARPDFLRNPVTGNNFNLELDCFCIALKLAVEYNGQQHYKFSKFMHKNKDAFTNQKYRDELKRRMCRDNNITLIEVPYTVSVSDIENFIVDKLRKTGYLR